MWNTVNMGCMLCAWHALSFWHAQTVAYPFNVAYPLTVACSAQTGLPACTCCWAVCKSGARARVPCCAVYGVQVVARLGWQPKCAWMDALLELCVADGRLGRAAAERDAAMPVVLMASLAYARCVGA